ncbi:thiamine-phosphate kinase [Cohnella candidum]|uniref:Thiamine-monophosphate kinase n=1 Tax=Cohnella candidum TaxID=2674991 RepID=A0A3G3JZW4_9BACL|nr:thiamine-phosphate kinase [Cohnella candidum]AYQ73790.1 thiamine-phosphate kinase [Cohnella candidum]
MPSPDEFALIRSWTAGRQSAERLALAGVKTGIGDDAAVVSPEQGHDLLLAMDTMVEEIHFLPETMEDADIGYKALAANVSDIAAMGGKPLHALISVSVPSAWGPERMASLYDGFYECADQYGIAVVGGDTTVSRRHLVVAVTLTGAVPSGRAVTRSGASPDEIVFVTGPVGLSAGGLYGMLPPGEGGRVPPFPPERLVRAHRKPVPSVSAGRILADEGWATSLNDVSDGLASEAWEIAESSGVTLVLHENRLPLSGELAAYASACRMDPLEWMLYGGEDYVLLGTAERRNAEAIQTRFRAEGLPFFVIGETESGSPGVYLDSQDPGRARKPIAKRGYNHFTKG